MASFECLHAIAQLYYNKLVPYMTEIYSITVKAIKEDQEDVALQVGEGVGICLSVLYLRPHA